MNTVLSWHDCAEALEAQRKEVVTKMMVNINPSEDFFIRNSWIMRRGISG
jgi:hypothetical protein